MITTTTIETLSATSDSHSKVLLSARMNTLKIMEHIKNLETLSTQQKEYIKNLECRIAKIEETLKLLS